ncbi:MAG: hypothetical protein BGO55_11485 [Sphingobacteriales bacterium 50-39]|nr:hypothetical protein [Sphingobacteriales bacterium]OJW54315.1 MAG: hypothetical protein BGO55_11485 [Sphingobacteriales bacterium 50-39]
MAAIMIKKIFLIASCVVYATLRCIAQSSSSFDKEYVLAKEIIGASRFKVFLNYNNLKIFIGTAYGNIQYGPKGLVTFIHESSHIYDNIKSAGMRDMRYYWSDSNQLLEVRVTPNYITSDSIASILPDYVTNKPLTQTYILCKGDCLSRSYGIFGLLEEFNAYSLEARSLVDMFGFFETCSYTNRPTFWEGYLKSTYDSWINFYYFNIFFSTYLKYASMQRRGFYNSLVNDGHFTNTFSQIYNKYNEALTALDSINRKVRVKVSSGNKKIYSYPFMEDYNSIRALAEDNETKLYLSMLLKK